GTQLGQVLVQQKAAVFFETLGMLVNKVLVGRSHEEQHAAHGVEQGDVAAGGDRKVQIRDVRGGRPPRVDDDDALPRPCFLAVANSVERDRVGLGHVAAEDEDDVGQLNIVVAAGRSVTTQTRPVTGHGGGHAQPAIRIGIVAAETAFEELVNHINGLGVELAAAVKGNGLRAVGVQDIGEDLSNIGEGGVPIGSTKAVVATQPILRLSETVGCSDG